MRWIEVTLDTPEKEIDARCDELTALGVEGFVIENESEFHDFLEHNRQYWDYVDKELEERYAGVSRIKFYLAEDDSGNAVLNQIKARYTVSTAFIEDSDWENGWKENYQPIPVGEKLVVVPQWLAVPDGDRKPLILDPGLIFGTGSHPTTRMCLEALEAYAGEGVHVLDLGCGSGILGIGAMVLGCPDCVGCDIDPKAPAVALSNAELNGIDERVFKVYAGDVIKDAGMRRMLGVNYQLVLANIVSDVIIPLSAFVRGFMAKDAAFICSGIIDGREDEVKAALIRNGFEVLDHLNEEEWHCFVCR